MALPEESKKYLNSLSDEEWNNSTIYKHIITRTKRKINTSVATTNYCFLSFHTGEQRDLFLEENEDLVKDYLMID